MREFIGSAQTPRKSFTLEYPGRSARAEGKIVRILTRGSLELKIRTVKRTGTARSLLIDPEAYDASDREFLPALMGPPHAHTLW